MIIVKFQGGLGNQLFQYMIYRKYQLLGIKVKADLSFYNHIPEGDTKRGFDLTNLLHLELNLATDMELKKFGKGDGILNCYRLLNRIVNRTYYDKEPYTFRPKIFKKKNLYLCGFWQDFRYFSDIYDSIRAELVFKPSKRSENRQLENEIRNSQSVSIHIRRGDYLRGANRERYGGVCDLEYYKHAMKIIETTVHNPQYYFFSDDPEWTRQQFKLPNSKIVMCNQEQEQYMDMHLMHCCKHNIIANSTFSWWGALLNRNKEKIVISPACLEHEKEITEKKRIKGWQYLK